MKRRAGRRAAYHAALLDLRRQGRAFVEALGAAAHAAQELDPAGTRPVDPLAEQVRSELAALLWHAAEHVPGAAELLARLPCPWSC